MKPYGWWMELEQKQKLTAALAGAVRELAAAGVPSPAVDARALAAHVLGKHLALAPSEFSPQQYANFSSLVSQRAQRIPLQHLIGKMWFRYLELKSVPGVFIVRPETELVAGEAISEIQRLQLIGEKDPLTIDLCTGSGAIALAVATETKNRNVHAVELAENAFMLAETNNIAYGSPVTFRIGDALTEFSEFIGKAAVVVSNPPYVPLTHELSPEVLADPEEALLAAAPTGLISRVN
ncbi:HemK/PrmC family methyltransferase [Arcanobacterium hippocoleae]